MSWVSDLFAKYFSTGATAETAVGAVNQLQHKQTRELVTCAGATAATTATLGAIPAGAMNVIVRTRVITDLTSAGALTGYTVGDGVTANLWGNTGVVGVAGTVAAGNGTTCGTTGGFAVPSWVPWYNALQQITLTAAGGNFVAGTVMVQVDYDLAPAMAE